MTSDQISQPMPSTSPIQGAPLSARPTAPSHQAAALSPRHWAFGLASRAQA